MKKQIAFIGAGKMASAVIKGLLNSQIFDKDSIRAAEVNEETAKKAQNDLGISIFKDAKEAIKGADIILMATKPFVVEEILESLKSDITEKQLIVSIAAGITFEKIERILGKKQRIIRVMPVTCDEADIDAITGVSGSGPAFYYYIIEQIARAGEKLGLNYETALTLSAQTALGAAKMVLETGHTPQELITAVTTPGGTTAEGNKVLAESSISEILFETVKKTAEKSESMSK